MQAKGLTDDMWYACSDLIWFYLDCWVWEFFEVKNFIRFFDSIWIELLSLFISFTDFPSPLFKKCFSLVYWTNNFHKKKTIKMQTKIPINQNLKARIQDFYLSSFVIFQFSPSVSKSYIIHFFPPPTIPPFTSNLHHSLFSIKPLPIIISSQAPDLSAILPNNRRRLFKKEHNLSSSQTPQFTKMSITHAQ